MGSKQPWDPWKMYDVAPNELRAIRERTKMRDAMKTEWLKKVTDPHRGAHDGGHIFDPAVQRFMSMRATSFDHFRVTPRTTWLGFLFVVLPVGLMSYFTIKDQEKREAQFRAGEVKYKDRTWYFMY
ncbi:NADH dehydrogenase [ubiquinone] 1 beta subcomplex subunit 4-like [Babylonia areolata]|uniref:NADH dehydrogenase [ubiquinone] 1 beta subcomplex subunit 4-like n=1 Tax=Babylonia areolata TaxID=304850 RepID=UPI003FD1E12C